MDDAGYTLAVDMSGRQGWVSLGRGDRILTTQALPDTRRPPRHRIELIPVIDQLCRQSGITPRELRQLYLSIGPGSFTGLRIVVTTAKMLAYVFGLRIVAVPTLDVMAHSLEVTDDRLEQLAVCLSIKRGTFYAGLFERQGASWRRQQPPSLMTWAELLARTPRPLQIAAEWSAVAATVTAPCEPAVDRCDLPSERLSETVWRLGAAAARAGRFTDPAELLPTYVRPPEAEILWNLRENSLGGKNV